MQSTCTKMQGVQCPWCIGPSSHMSLGCKMHKKFVTMDIDVHSYDQYTLNDKIHEIYAPWMKKALNGVRIRSDAQENGRGELRITEFSTTYHGFFAEYGDGYAYENLLTAYEVLDRCVLADRDRVIEFISVFPLQWQTDKVPKRRPHLREHIPNKGVSEMMLDFSF